MLISTLIVCLLAFMTSNAFCASLKDAVELYQKNQYEQAVIMLRRMIKDDNNNIDAHRYLVKCYNKMKKLDDVASEYNTLKVKEQNNPIYRFMIAYIYDLKGNTIGAMQGYEEVKKMNPKLAYLNYNLGWIYDDQGEINQAIKHYEAEIKYNPGNVDAHYNLIKDYLKKKNYQKVLQISQKMLAVAPNDIRAYDSRGWVFYEQGDVEQAIEQWKKTIKLSPKDIEAGENNVRGLVLHAKGLYNSAMREYKKG